MTISRCSDLLAMLVKKPLRLSGLSKARLERTESVSNMETELLLTQDFVDLHVMDGQEYVLNIEAMTRCVYFPYR